MIKDLREKQYYIKKCRSEGCKNFIQVRDAMETGFCEYHKKNKKDIKLPKLKYRDIIGKKLDPKTMEVIGYEVPVRVLVEGTCRYADGIKFFKNKEEARMFNESLKWG